MLVSDCCGVELSGMEVDYGICHCCGEHCSIVNDETGELVELD